MSASISIGSNGWNCSNEICPLAPAGKRLTLGPCHFCASFQIFKPNLKSAFRFSVTSALPLIFILSRALEDQRGSKRLSRKQRGRDFPGGAVVKSPPASAGDTGSGPGPGRSHMPRRDWARAPQLLSLCSRAREPQLLSRHVTTTEARAPRACALQQERPPQWEACAPQRRVAPTRRNWRKPARSNEDPTQPKINK